ncbi:MAG: MOSC domain-containing protein [Verrucomicrobiota bacterium]
MNVLHIYICPQHIFKGHHGKPPGETPIEEVDSIECVAGSGIKGDRFFDHKPDFKGQITFFDHAVYQRLCDTFGVHDKNPSVFRRNIITDGADLNTLIGQEFELQGLRFLGTEECSPCYWMNQVFHEGAEDALKGHGGLRAKIISGGTLHRSDSSA